MKKGFTLIELLVVVLIFRNYHKGKPERVVCVPAFLWAEKPVKCGVN